MNNILIIEDDNDIRSLIVYNLEKNGFKIIEADNANDALISLEEVNIDAILLDIMLPGLNGIQFLEIIRRKENTSRTPVIIISAKNAEHDIISALEKGADDYLPKPFSMEMLNAKIKSVLRRTVGSENYTPTLEYKNIKMDDTRHKVFSSGVEIKLTNKEYELLRLFMASPHRIFTRNKLLNTVWGYDSESLTRTVDAHISTLRKKLGDNGEIIKSIPKIGYGLEI